jgi:hypothetical protein
MTEIRVLAAHQVVQLTHPRPIRDEDRLGIAMGRAIDGALSKFSHEAGQGRRPTATAMRTYAAELLTEELAEQDVAPTPEERVVLDGQIAGVLQEFRKSPLFGLPRPRSRLVLIGEEVGIYAQPDYWDGRGVFYEMKSYRAVPHPPDVELQLRLFRLAFPNFRGYLACFDRHASPVTTTIEPLEPLPEPVALEVLRNAYELGRQHGAPKVLEYLDATTIRYARPPSGAAGAPDPPPSGA